MIGITDGILPAVLESGPVDECVIEGLGGICCIGSQSRPTVHEGHLIGHSVTQTWNVIYGFDIGGTDERSCRPDTGVSPPVRGVCSLHKVTKIIAEDSRSLSGDGRESRQGRQQVAGFEYFR